MKPNPALLSVAIAATCMSAYAASPSPAVPSVQSTLESRTALAPVDGATSVDKPTGDVIVAQTTREEKFKDVRTIMVGGTVHIGDSANVDALVSKAMAEAFSTPTSSFLRPVKNAPYSAEIITENIQSLPDGNQISKRTSALTFRDSAGRTRQEVRDTRGNVTVIHINNPVEETRYIVSPSQKTATKISVDKNLSKRIDELKDRAKTMTKDGKVVIVEKPGPGEEVVIQRTEGTGANGKKEIREEIKVNVVRANTNGDANAGERVTPRAYAYKIHDDAVSIIPSPSGSLSGLGPLAMAFQDGKWSSKAGTTPLGIKEIDGVRAEGTLSSYTIPAGEIGNRNPIVVSTEAWYSPELQITLYSKHSDPRVGDTVYRLANVKRSEQPATLFTVPEGYTVKEGPAISFNVRTK